MSAFPLSVLKLKKVFTAKKRSITAVDEVSFILREGEILGLLGPNGSGKTTTIQMLLGTLTPTSGQIAYFGKDLTLFRSEILQEVAFASTYASLPYVLTIRENLDFIGRLYGFPPRESAKKYDPLLKRFGILENRDQRVSSLSAGQLTRLVLVKAFFTEPKVILLDEPTASLDPEMADEVCRFLLEERTRRGIAILFTSHKMEEAVKLCDRTIFLKTGKIIADGSPEKLAKSHSPFSLKLTIVDGMERAEAFVKKQKFRYFFENRSIQIFLQEEEIPPLLTGLVRENINYTTISVVEPSLEDYFLHLARQKS